MSTTTGPNTPEHITPIARSLLSECRKILADGELGSDEIWALGNWINEHLECTKCWPGNLIAPAVHSAFADGIVEVSELQILASVLLSVDHEAGGLSATEDIQSETDNVGTTSAERISLVVPSVPHSCQVRSYSSSDRYDVDLDGHTCSCPDWMDRRRGFPVGSPSRCCKHIVCAFFAAGRDHHLLSDVLMLFRACYDSARGPDVGADYISLLHKGRKALIAVRDSDWMNVYAFVDGDRAERFGFNMEEKRWAYGDSPRGLATVVRQLAKALRSA